MTSTEIWLRLISIGSLGGEEMRDVAEKLSRQTVIDNGSAREAGLSAKRAEKFVALSECELESSLKWLEQPGHHLLTAHHPLYPPLLRTLPDYPGALFVKGSLDVLTTLQLAVVGSRAPS